MRNLIFALLFVVPPAFAGLCEDYNAVQSKAFISSVRDGLWSSASTWGGVVPGPADDVRVAHSVVADDAMGAEIQIDGLLNVTGYLEAHGSVIVCEGGTLSGTEGEINLVVENDRAFASNLVPGPVGYSPGFHPADNGLWVAGGGTLDLQGPEVTSWLNAAPSDSWAERQYGVMESVAFGNGIAGLAEAPVGWAAGDTLLLVTERGAHGTAVLESIDGQVVTYTGSDLVGYVLEFNGRQVAPKVANLTRRFAIYSGLVSEGDTNHRAHTAYLPGSTIQIDSVEFRNLGPRAKLGRYPVHWHHARSAAGDYIRGSSIWQDVTDAGSRFIVPHIVNGIRVENNVGYRSQGHGFFMEEVEEFGNAILHNLSVDVRLPDELPHANSRIAPDVHHFWLRAGNEISGNVAAGHNYVVDGSRGKGVQVNGIVLLPSSVADPAPAVGPFECLGCGIVGAWSQVDNSTWENLVSVYALSPGFRVWRENNTFNSQSLVEPLLLINGENETYTRLFPVNRDLAYRSVFSNAAQIFVNNGGVSVVGGDLAGDDGLHSHYNATFSLDGVSYQGTGGLIAPSYFEADGAIENTTAVGPLFDSSSLRSYTNRTKAFPPEWPDIIRVSDTVAEGQVHNATYTASWLAEHFESTQPTDLYRIVRVDGAEPAPNPDPVDPDEPDPVDPPPPDPEPEPLTLEQRVRRIEIHLGL